MRTNPFTPSFGSNPRILAGRENVLAPMRQAFEQGYGDPNLASILVGARGTGKTTLLSGIIASANERGWLGVNVSALPGMLDDILQQSYRRSGHVLEPEKKMRLSSIEISKLLNVKWEALQEPTQNWRSKMTRILEGLEEHDIGLLICVDEVDPTLDEVKELVSVYQHFVQENRHVALVLAGLPHKVSSLLADDDISFLRRARRHDIGRISDADVRFALERTFEDGGKAIRPEAAELSVRAIQGFPYMLQLVGYWIWNTAGYDPTAGTDAATKGIALAREDMRQGILGATYDTLSDGDRRFIAAMLQDPEKSTLSAVASRMGVKSNYASRYKRRLLEQGIIGEYGRNVLRFEIPASREYFDEERLSEDE